MSVLFYFFRGGDGVFILFIYLFFVCFFVFCFLRILIILKHTRGEGRYLKFIKRCNSIKFLIGVYFKTHSVRGVNVLKELIVT